MNNRKINKMPLIVAFKITYKSHPLPPFFNSFLSKFQEKTKKRLTGNPVSRFKANNQKIQRILTKFHVMNRPPNAT